MRSSAKYIFWILLVAFVGWLALDTSGVLGAGGGVTPGTTVAQVNGEEITVAEYQAAVNQMTQQAQQQGASLTLDDQRRLEQMAFDQLVGDILIRQELHRRGIDVSVQEIQQAALTMPPPQLLQSPEFQTEGQFDPAKYQRWITSPAVRQQGVLVMLEGYYRSEIPKAKLAEQIVAGTHISDAQLWAIYRDTHDSATVSYVSFGPELVADSAVSVSEDEIRAYYPQHRDELAERPGRAVVTLTTIPRPITAADSATTFERAQALRQEIVSGQSTFENVAERESIDSVSAAQGGLLGRQPKGRFVPEFDSVAYAIPVGEVSQPFETSFGVHLLRVDERSRDTATVRHVLIPFRQSDSSAAAVDRRADELARIEQSTEVSEFDSATKAMNLETGTVVAIEGEPLVWNGRYVPDIGAWAFRSAEEGHISALVAGEEAYYLARLDSLSLGGRPSLDAVRDDIRRQLMREKKIQAAAPRAAAISNAVSQGASFEAAARQAGQDVQQTPMFTRTMAVPGLGRYNRAVGAAFGLPVGAVSQPIVTDNAVYVLRVDRRTQADRAAFEAQKAVQRAGTIQQLREQRVQQFISNLRQAANVRDYRRETLYQAEALPAT
jgi:peptidyl-prolyl cis-trans isomerase D